jgi:type VI secretion system protein ImpL
MNPTVILTTIVVGAVALIIAGITMFVQKKTQDGIDKASQGGQGGQGAPAAAGGSGGGEADDLIRAASARLAQSKAGAGVANLPMIFVIGDKGTAKTSTILNSGLDPELLAGQVFQDNAVAPTRSANIFFARGTVFVEAGGALMANPQSWTSLVKKLQPSRLKSLGASGQAPRGVLLCFDLETFARAGASDAIVNATRYLQARLGEISDVLGISFPVYVLFTRADRLPFFAEFVRNLSAEEAGQVVGATVPIRAGAASGVYAEEETQRLTWAFNQLFHSFCDQRLLLLPREGDPMKLPQAYEFPREFRKLRNSMVQFLVDVCRPSQLRSSPFLRGFYFSGVRPVAAAETPVGPLVDPTTPAQQLESGGATRMFRAGFQAEQRAKQAIAQPGGGAGKRVPQWLFLGHLFNDVVLADANARAASGSSTKTSVLKRILLASAAGLCLMYAGLLIWSYFENRALEQEVLEAAGGIQKSEGANGATPGIDPLHRLDQVRKTLANLTKWGDSAPFGMGFGLYRGKEIRDDVRKIYYAKFRQLLFGSTLAQMLAYLSRLPAAPGQADEYSPPYDTLKAYLLTTSDWTRSSDAGLQSFLASKLDAKWIAAHEGDIGKDRLDLVKTQFDFYASDLHNGNPYSYTAEKDGVARSRTYLAGFPGLQRVYQGLLSMADKQVPTTTFNKNNPGSETVLASSEPVRGAFTKAGWKVVQDAISKQDFGGEVWVLGDYKGQAPDKGRMQQDLRDLYVKEYIAQWRNVLNKSNVVGYRGLKDASNKLIALSGSSAPLLALFWWTSQNTCDVPGVADKFAAPQAVVPCSNAKKYVVGPNEPYNTGLLALQLAVDHAADPSANKEEAMRDMGQKALAALGLARGLSSGFTPDDDGKMHLRSAALLEQPIRYLDGMVSSDLKGAGVGFCDAFNKATFRKFPFDPLAKDEAKLEDLQLLLQPTKGQLWTFYEKSLKSVLQCSNGQCSASGTPPLNPVFVTFIGNLMKFSRAIYGDDGTEMNYQYSLTPQKSDLVDEFDVTVNGVVSKLKGGTQHSYTWPGTGPRNFGLDLKLVGGGSLAQQMWTYDGPWAVFKGFSHADQTTGNVFSWTQRSGQDQQPQRINGKPLTYELSVGTTGPAVFSKDFLLKLKCALPVAR